MSTGKTYSTKYLLDSKNNRGAEGQVLSSTDSGIDWVTLSEISGVDGTGTANYLSKWLDANTITNSLVYDNGTNVGIGTTSPAQKLDVDGNIVAARFIQDTNAGNNFYAAGFTRSSSSLNNPDIYDLNGHGLVLGGTSNESTLVLKSGGKVGIGTTNPSKTLEVNGTLKTASDITCDGTTIFGGTSSLNINLFAAGSLNLKTNNTTALTINSSQEVGIGTTTPSEKLHVQGAVGTTNGTAALPTHTFYSDNDTGMYRAAVNTLAFSTGGTERMRITSAGDVDVNGITTSDAFRTDTSNTDYNVISRNSTSTTLWVQAAQSGSLQGIASFRYGSSTVNAGTEVCAIRRNSSYFINTKLGVGTSSPSVTLDVDGPIKHKVYTVSTLPSASPAGQRAFVSDAYYDLASSHGSTFPGGGSYTIPCYSDGSDWRAG